MPLDSPKSLGASENLDSERKRIPAYYSNIIRERLEPLMAYAKGGENARLQLELGVNYLKITERDEHRGELRTPEKIIKLTGGRADFMKAYIFSSLLRELYEKGDIAYDPKKDVSPEDALSVKREDMKEEVTTLFRDRIKWHVAGKILNYASLLIVKKYDVFGIGEKNVDHIRLGYRLEENLRIVVTDKSV